MAKKKKKKDKGRSKAKRAAAPKKTKKKPAKRKTVRVVKAKTPKQAAPKPAYGAITHTELASNDPDATKAWCAKALGWTFKPSMPSPDGDYHLFMYSDQGGGGIRQIKAPEVAGTVPYVNVKDTQAAFDKAIAAGAEVMFPPMRVNETISIACVRAPGGVPVGLAGP